MKRIVGREIGRVMEFVAGAAGRRDAGRSGLGALLLAVVFVLAGIPSAPGLSVRPLTSEQVLANSDMVVVATVVGSSVRWTTPERVMIATDYRLRLDQVVYDPKQLYGAKAAGDVITMSFAGGVLDGEGVRIPGVPEFHVGDQVVLFTNGEDLDAICPLTGATQGLYRVKTDSDGVKRVFRSAGCSHTPGTPVTKGYFGSSSKSAAGFSLSEFVAEVERALPEVKSRPDLLVSDQVVIPKEKAHLIFTGDQIPQQTPLHKSQPIDGLTTAAPAADPAKPPQAPLPPEARLAPTSGTVEVGSLKPSEPTAPAGDEKYRFLWASPTAPHTYDIPPSLYGASANWGINFEYCETDWNFYASNVFNKLATGDENFGKNSRNDFAFTNSSGFQSTYGFSWPNGTLGIAVMFNSSNNPIQTNEQIVESDVIFNSGISWTLDWDTAYSGGGSIFYFRSTAIHEIGHTFGREHSFTENSSATWNSVMNYPPSGALDTEFYKPYGDDAASIRAAYPSRAVSLTDIGVYLYRTAGYIASGATGVDVLWAGFPSSVTAGSSFTVSDFMVENLGTSTQSPQVDFWLVPNQRSFTGGYYCSSAGVGSLGSFSQSRLSSSVNVPSTVPAGQYYIAATLNAGDSNDWNKTSYSNTKITVQAAPSLQVSTQVLWPSTMLGTNASSQNFTISNSGSGNLNYTVSDDVSWLSCSPSSGSVGGTAQSVTVTYATSGLSKGTYNGTITISSSNGLDSPKTIAVTLTVMAPTIERSTSSLSQSVTAGQNASGQSFTVRNSGDGTLNYSISDDVSWLSCSPASGSSTGESDTINVTYSTSGLSAGSYSGVITITASGASNSPMTVLVSLTVNPGVTRPSNDNFANRTLITSTATGTNVNATAETGEPNHKPGILAQKSVWWTWTPGSSGTATVSTAGSNFDTLLGVYTGSSVGALTMVAQDDDSGGNSTSQASFSVTAGVEYKIAVDGYHSCDACSAAEGNISLSVTVATPQPSIGVSPSSLTFNGTQGGSNPASQTLNVSNTTAGSGSMSYTISTSYQSGQPTGWLSVSPTSGSSSGSNSPSTVSANLSGLSAGTYNATLSVSSGQAVNSPRTVPVTFIVATPATPANNNFASRTAISGSSGTSDSTNVGATAEAGEPAHQTGIPASKSIWWKWTAPSNGTVSFATLGTATTFDTFLAVYTGASLGSLTQVGSNDNSPSSGEIRSLLQLNVTAGTEYQIVVDGARASSGAATPEGNVTLTYNFSPASPTAPAFGYSPTSVTFNAVAGGSNPPDQGVGIYNQTLNSGALSYNLSVTYGAGASGWLTVSPMSGTSTSGPSNYGDVVAHWLSVNTAGRAAGTYTATITMTAAGASNSPQSVGVTLNLSSGAPANDAFAAATLVTGSTGSVTGTNTAATRETGEPASVAGVNITKSVWWKWTAPWNGRLTAHTYGSGIDTVLGCYTGSAVSALTLVAGNDNAYSGVTHSQVAVNVTAGTTYYFLLDGNAGAAGSVKLNWSAVQSVAPVIAAIPDASISAGAAYTGPTPTLSQGNNAITWTLPTKPAGMTINASTGVVSWPSPTATGSPHTVVIRATNNAGYDEESWLLTVTSPCTYALSPASTSVPHSGGSGSVAVTAGGTCSWTATSSAGWLTITSGTSGTGNGSIGYSASANTGTAARSATITVAGQTHTVTQAGVPATTSLRLQQQTRVAATWEGWQHIVVNYQTNAITSTPYQSGAGAGSYALPLNEWMGIYLYDYAVGGFTQAMYRQKAPM